jgi:hypothetical protein
VKRTFWVGMIVVAMTDGIAVGLGTLYSTVVLTSPLRIVSPLPSVMNSTRATQRRLRLLPSRSGAVTGFPPCNCV